MKKEQENIFDAIEEEKEELENRKGRGIEEGNNAFKEVVSEEENIFDRE